VFFFFWKAQRTLLSDIEKTQGVKEPIP